MTDPDISDVSCLFIEYTKSGCPVHSRMQAMGDNVSTVPSTSVTNICWKVLSQLFLPVVSALLLWLNILRVKHDLWQEQVIHTHSLYVFSGRSCSDSEFDFFIHERTFHWRFKHRNYISKQWEFPLAMVRHPVSGGSLVFQNQGAVISEMHLITCGYLFRLMEKSFLPSQVHCVLEIHCHRYLSLRAFILDVSEANGRLISKRRYC